VFSSKASLRESMREQLSRITPAQRLTASHQARTLLERQTVWTKARTVFFYAPLPGELDVWPLVEDSLTAGKVVCLPRFEAATGRYVACEVRHATRDVVTGRFGIREPADGCVLVPLNRLDLILVPGVAFDTRGHRLGRGKGYYDRLLSEAGGIHCGIAFDEQIFTEIPIEPHDVRLNCIVTPTRWIEL
jgi:5-formyltetrahydrofolate cyclo-ligase